jgi:cell wall-associated NlpC family hydrolase
MIPQSQIDLLISEARKLIGTPFRHQGRSTASGVGVDCIGALVLAANNSGFKTHDKTDYGRIPHPQRFLSQLALTADRVSNLSDATKLGPDSGVANLLTKGDIIVFWSPKPNLPRHAGLWTGTGLLHTWQQVGKVVEHRLEDSEWYDKMHSLWRLKA